MSEFVVQITKVVEGGPYSYVIFKGGDPVALKSENGAADSLDAFSKALAKIPSPVVRVLAQVSVLDG